MAALANAYMTIPAGFQRQVFESRVGDPAKFTSDAARAIELRIERNRLLNERIRSSAAAHGLTVFEVDGGHDLPAMTERVRASSPTPC